MSVPPRAVQLNEANAFLKEHPEVLYVDLLIADMNGVVRGKRIERTSLHKVYEKGINLPASSSPWTSTVPPSKAPGLAWTSAMLTASATRSPTRSVMSRGKSAPLPNC